MVVLESALIRGVMSALAWLHGDMRTQQFGTCEDALDAALTVLTKAGWPTPPRLVPSRWRRPGHSPRSEPDSTTRVSGPRSDPDSTTRATGPRSDPASQPRGAAGGRTPRR